ncbi:unnamed protein product [Ectocarpus sp. CCAP 1310/34]|nr:unnamed protein product [Ectocarpus sp. CCAP 1310/34]
MASRETGRRLPEGDTSAAHVDTNAAPSSPTSSQGSWVVDPDDGWDDSGSTNVGPNELPPSAAVPPSPESPRREHHRRTPLSPSSPLRSWAQVPMSPPAAEYPAMTTSTANSPPPSPGSVRSLKSVGSVSSDGGGGSSRRSVAGEGLVALARDENPTLDTTGALLLTPRLASKVMDTSDSAAPTGAVSRSPAVLAPRSLPLETFEALEAQGFSGAWGGAGAGSASTGQDREVDGVGAATAGMDVSGFPDPADEAFVMTAAPGMTAAEAVEAIAEAAELTGITPTSVVLSRTTMSPSRASSGRPSPNEGEEKAQGVTFRRAHGSPAATAAAARFRAREPLRNLSSSTANTAAAGAAGVARVPDIDASRDESVTVPAASGSTYIPMDTAVGMGVDVDDVDGTYDRLWRWTGFLTAAKMGVIPIIVCATVAALSTQSSSGDRGGRGAGGGSGGGRGGGRGGGGTRCSSRRRPQGGGGGGGCFPDVRIDRCVYGGMPMPYCVAPSVACA